MKENLDKNLNNKIITFDEIKGIEQEIKKNEEQEDLHIKRLNELTALKKETTELEIKIQEAESEDEYKKLKAEFKEKNTEMINLTTYLARKLGDKINDIYSFDDINERIKRLERIKIAREEEERKISLN